MLNPGEDIKDKDVEVEELKFRINSESGAMTEVKKTIGDLEREIKQLKSDVTEKIDLLNEKVHANFILDIFINFESWFKKFDWWSPKGILSIL